MGEPAITAVNRYRDRYRGMTDIALVALENSKQRRIKIHRQRDFDLLPLSTNRNKYLPRAFASTWVFSAARDEPLENEIVRTYDIDGIRRVSNLKDLGLDRFKGQKNVLFSVDQYPNNMEPNFSHVTENGDKIACDMEIYENESKMVLVDSTGKKITPGTTLLTQVADSNTIQAFANMPCDGTLLSPSEYERLVGVPPKRNKKLDWSLSDSAHNRLLAGVMFGCAYHGWGIPYGSYLIYRFGEHDNVKNLAASAAYSLNKLFHNVKGEFNRDFEPLEELFAQIGKLIDAVK